MEIQKKKGGGGGGLGNKNAMSPGQMTKKKDWGKQINFFCGLDFDLIAATPFSFCSFAYSKFLSFPCSLALHSCSLIL